MPEDVLNRDTYKYLKLLYKEYYKRIKAKSSEPDYFDCANFNKKSSKINETILRKSMSTLFDLKFAKRYTDGGFLLNNAGINYIETHSTRYRFKKWLSSNIVSIIALVVSVLSFCLSLISLLLDLPE